MRKRRPLFCSGQHKTCVNSCYMLTCNMLRVNSFYIVIQFLLFCIEFPSYFWWNWALCISLQDRESRADCSLLKFILTAGKSGGGEEKGGNFTFCMVSNTVIPKISVAFTQALIINDVISTEIYTPLYSDGKFCPKGWKCSADEKLICIKI